MNDLKDLNCFLVLCKTRKKFEKYIKLNKVRKKYVIDISKIMQEESIKSDELSTSNILKVLILKKINLAKEKKMNIYYIPSLQHQSQISNLFNIKALVKDTHNFNLIYLYEDFEPGQQPQEILDRIEDFDISQVLKDY